MNHIFLGFLRNVVLLVFSISIISLTTLVFYIYYTIIKKYGNLQYMISRVIECFRIKFWGLFSKKLNDLISKNIIINNN